MQDKKFNGNKDDSLLTNHNINHLIDNNPIVNNYKRKAKILHKKLKEEHLTNNKNILISLRQCQDLVAQQHGYKHWHEFHKNIKKLYLDKKETNFLKYDLQSHIPQFGSNNLPINIGYNPELALNVWIDQDKLLEHVFIDGEDSFRNKMELHLIQQLIKKKEHIIYMDGQNNLDHIQSIIEYAKQAGREKDIRILSFLNSSEQNPILEPYYWKLPQMLPFNSGDLIHLILYLIDNDSHNDNDVWRGRAISLISPLLMALTYMRDRDGIILDFNTIKHYLVYDNFITLSHQEFPPHIKSAFRNFLLAFPGFQEFATKQHDTVLMHYGFLEMQFTQALNCLNNYKFLSNPENTVEGAKKRWSELYGENKKYIFIIQFPDFSMNPDKLELSYFMNGVISNLASIKLKEGVQTKNTLLSQQFQTYLFLNNCPLPNKFAVMPTQFKQLNTSLILSYKTTEDKNCAMTRNDEIFKSLSYNMKTKIKENSDEPIKYNNKTSYKLISQDINEDLTL